MLRAIDTKLHMKVTRENTSKTQMKLTIELTAEEVQPFLLTAAVHISEHMDIPGFRKGKATFDAVVNQVGQMRVLEEAIEPIVRLHTQQALTEEGITPVGQPKIEVEKMVPGSEFVFTAEVARMPEVKKMGDYKKLSIDAKSTEASDEDIAQALKDLTRMQTKEVRGTAEDKAVETDMLVINMEMKRDGVAVEGGQAQDFKILLAEHDLYIPGMTQELHGLKEGDKKTFTLTIPEENYQKHLAGQDVEISVEVKELFHLEAPTVDDAFATSLGLKDEKDLREKIAENIKNENEGEERFRQEREMLELLAEKSSFEEIPDILVNDEVEKMFHELEHSIEKQGGKFVDYMSSIDKTPAQIKEGMRDQALVRVKVAILLEEVAKQEKVEVKDEEVQKEIDTQSEAYPDNEQVKERLQSEQYKQYTKYRIRNKRTIDLIRGHMVKEA